MRQLLLSCILMVCTILPIIAQTLDVTLDTEHPGTIALEDNVFVIQGTPDESDVVAYTVVTNNIGEAVNFTWTRTEMDLPNDSWVILSCDNDLCWGPTTTNNTFVLGPGASTVMQIHFKPSTTSGWGSVSYTFEGSNAAGTVLATSTATYQGHVFAVGIEEEPVVNNEVQLYPNPVCDQLNLNFDSFSEVQSAEIYDLIGKKIGTYNLRNAFGQYRIDTNDFDAGMYFISFLNANHEILNTKVFTKSH